MPCLWRYPAFPRHRPDVIRYIFRFLPCQSVTGHSWYQYAEQSVARVPAALLPHTAAAGACPTVLSVLPVWEKPEGSDHRKYSYRMSLLYQIFFILTIKINFVRAGSNTFTVKSEPGSDWLKMPGGVWPSKITLPSQKPWFYCLYRIYWTERHLY